MNDFDKLNEILRFGRTQEVIDAVKTMSLEKQKIVLCTAVQSGNTILVSQLLDCLRGQAFPLECIVDDLMFFAASKGYVDIVEILKKQKKQKNTQPCIHR